MTNSQHRRLNIALLVALVGTAALSLQALLTPQLWDVHEDATGHDVGVGGNDARILSITDEMKLEDQYHRMLIPTVEEIFGKEDEDLLAIPGEDFLRSSENDEGETSESETEYSATTATPHAKLIDDNQPLPPYTIEDAIESSEIYDRNFALLVYDPSDDEFYTMYTKRHLWVGGCTKLLKSVRSLTYLLRKNFPERFQGEKSEELIIPVSSGDTPGVRDICINHFRQEPPDPSNHPSRKNTRALGKGCSHDIAPILHFGSVFRHSRTHLFPNIIAMPMPVPQHLNCFDTWAAIKIVCDGLRAAGHDKQAQLVFGEEYGLKWEDLIPQLVWRGTDFAYLTNLHPILKRPNFREGLINGPLSQKEYEILGLTAFNGSKIEQILDHHRSHDAREGNQQEQIRMGSPKATAVQSLKEQYSKLLPRWKAVVLTAEAEVNAQPNTLPWADMKFSHYVHSGRKSGTLGADEYKEWEGIGIATGDCKSLRNLAKYKYQIDLGGGGGTSWSGTIEKLAMPGLLFHHMTPTKDYIHDWMKPWVHYIPVSPDLLDLKQKFDWAESHPLKSKQIADEGTELMRYLTSPKGFEKLYQQDIVQPLRRVIEAYQPISAINKETPWKTWRDAIDQIDGPDILFPVYKCSGSSARSCTHIERTIKQHG